MKARYIVGDVRAVLATLEPASVDLVLTSPPFLALRSYLPAGHPDKPSEIGSEATPGAYIDTLLDVVEACSRVLAPHGSMCFELGDTYAGSGGAGGDYNAEGLRAGQPKFRQLSPAKTIRPNGCQIHHRPSQQTPLTAGDGWPLDKSLCLIPEIFRFSLVYGFNPLTGRQTPRWRARNVIRWCRPNPPVGALGDKFRPATSDMVVVCKGRRRYFDLDAVRTEHTAYTFQSKMGTDPNSRNDGGAVERYTSHHPAGAPPLDWWKISTQPYEGAHYATWPEQLCVTPIKAMSPARVCTVCGQPSERIVEDNDELAEAKRLVGGKWQSGGLERGLKRPNGSDRIDVPGYRNTVGWTDCGHGSWRPGMVLDPFAGSGTTLQVATGHGRDAIGIDLDSRNGDLALDRTGPLLLAVSPFDYGDGVLRPNWTPDKHRYQQQEKA